MGLQKCKGEYSRGKPKRTNKGPGEPTVHTVRLIKESDRTYVRTRIKVTAPLVELSFGRAHPLLRGATSPLPMPEELRSVGVDGALRARR